jgi:hypothetical protein
MKTQNACEERETFTATLVRFHRLAPPSLLEEESDEDYRKRKNAMKRARREQRKARGK